MSTETYKIHGLSVSVSWFRLLDALYEKWHEVPPDQISDYDVEKLRRMADGLQSTLAEFKARS